MKKYFDTGFYKGELENGLPHGKGTFIDCQGQEYQGQWNKGKREGKGSFTWPYLNTSVNGNWKNDVLDGDVLCHYPNGFKRQGVFVNGEFHGTATYYKPNNDKVLEYWDSGCLINEKELRNANNYNNPIDFNPLERNTYLYSTQFSSIDLKKGRYHGELKDDKKNGRGTLVFNDHSSFVGDFKEDKRHGKGIAFYPNKDARVGTWRNDRLHGTAVYYYGSSTEVDVEKYENGELLHCKHYQSYKKSFIKTK